MSAASLLRVAGRAGIGSLVGTVSSAAWSLFVTPLVPSARRPRSPARHAFGRRAADALLPITARSAIHPVVGARL